MRGWPFLVMATMGCATVDNAPSPGRDPSPATGFPGRHWEAVPSPEAEGYSTTKLHRELVTRDWVTELTTPTSRAEEVHGYERWGLAYGKLWWLFDDPGARAGGPLQGAYSAIGAYGQYISIVPKLDMVIAHKVVHETNEEVGVAAYRQLIEAIVACRRADD